MKIFQYKRKSHLASFVLDSTDFYLARNIPILYIGHIVPNGTNMHFSALADSGLLVLLHLTENKAGTSLTSCLKEAGKEQKLLKTAEFALAIAEKSRYECQSMYP